MKNYKIISIRKHAFLYLRVALDTMLSTCSLISVHCSNNRFLGSFDDLTSLTVVNDIQQKFLKIHHYCKGFKRKMRRVG